MAYNLFGSMCRWIDCDNDKKDIHTVRKVTSH